jgi:hypothetical protein
MSRISLKSFGVLALAGSVALGATALSSQAKADFWSRNVAPIGHAIDKAKNDAGKAIEKGAQDAGKTAEKAAQDTGHTLEKGAQDTGNTLEKAVHDIGHSIEKAGQDVGKFFAAPVSSVKNYVDAKIKYFTTLIQGIIDKLLAIASKAVWALAALSGVLFALLMTAIFRRPSPPRRRRAVRTAS